MTLLVLDPLGPESLGEMQLLLFYHPSMQPPAPQPLDIMRLTYVALSVRAAQWLQGKQILGCGPCMHASSASVYVRRPRTAQQASQMEGRN